MHFRYLLNVNGGLLRAARSLDEHLGTAGRLARRRRAAATTKAAAFVDGFVRPFGRDEPATPRFVDAVEEAGSAAGAGARARVAPAPGSGSWCCIRSRPLLALHLRTQPWRKRTRHKLRQAAAEAADAALLRRIKQFAIDHLGAAGKRASRRPRLARSALTPKTGRQRDPAKTLAGTDVREARRRPRAGHGARAGAAGRSSSGRGCRKPASSCSTGFRSWRGRRPTAISIRSRLVVVSRGGAAPWYRHITPHYEDIFSFFTPDEFRRQERRPHRGAGRPAEAPRDLVLRPRDHRPRRAPERGLRGRRAAAPVADVPAVRPLLVPARAGDAGRGVHVVRAAAGPATGSRHPAAPARRATSPPSSTATRRCPTTPENRALRRRPMSPIWPHTSTSCCSTPRSGSTTTRTSRRR